MSKPNLRRVYKGDRIDSRFWNQLIDADQTSHELETTIRERDEQISIIGKIVTNGPPDEAGQPQPDYNDERYWIEPVRLVWSEGDSISWQEYVTSGPFQTAKFIFTAVNMAEVGIGDHGLAPGTIIVARYLPDHRGRSRAVFNPGGGGSSAIQSVRIWVAMATLADGGTGEEGDPEQPILIANFQQHGPHLACFPVRADGTPIINESPLVVFPHWERSVAEFKDGDEQFYNISDLSDPIYFAYRTTKGLMLQLGEGQVWTKAPKQEEICAFRPSMVGACCLDLGESCISTIESVCLAQEGVFKGVGSLCETPNICEPGGPGGPGGIGPGG